MDRLVERVIDEDNASALYALTTMLLTVPRDISAVDAVVVLPGLGENWRLHDAIKAWEVSKSARHMFVTGMYEQEDTWVRLDVDNLSKPPFNLGRTENVHTQVYANHTKDQVDWVVQQVEEHGIESLALFVSPYHLPRAYATLLRAFTRHKVAPIPMIPCPVKIAPHIVIPETGVTAWGMAPGEAQRIVKYQQVGDVATQTELEEYLAYLWAHPILTGSDDDSQWGPS